MKQNQKKSHKNLHMSKKSSNFARFFLPRSAFSQKEWRTTPLAAQSIPLSPKIKILGDPEKGNEINTIKPIRQ